MMTVKSIVCNAENEGLGKLIILHARTMGLVIRRERRTTGKESGRHEWYVFFGNAECAKGCVPDLELHVASASHCGCYQPSAEEEERALRILLHFLCGLSGNPLSESFSLREESFNISETNDYKEVL